MRSSLFTRVVSAVLCLCLVPMIALAETTVSPVTNSEFTLSLNLHADGYPESTSRLKDWEAFLQKLEIKGYLNTQDFLNPYSRVYLNGGLYVKGKERIPFIYDGYHSYRYFVSPAIAGESMHFQMHNFFEFMLKPYYYMELPTQYLALLLYPEASYFVGDSYYTPIAETLAGEGTRTIPYEDLYELCETLDLLVNDDPDYERMYFYITSLLTELYAADMTLGKLGELEEYLDYLDPEQEGMTITVSGNRETYVLGETTVFEKKQAGDAVAFTLTLPDADGYELAFQYDWTPTAEGAALNAGLMVTQGKQVALSIAVNGTGLPCEGNTVGNGRVSFALGGDTFTRTDEQMFDFRWSTSAAELPYDLSLEIDWLHPETGKAALTLRYEAAMKTVKPSVFKEEAYRQDDFFSLNEGFLEAYKERFLPTLATAFLPILLEMPSGVLDDMMEFATETEILTALGL